MNKAKNLLLQIEGGEELIPVVVPKYSFGTIKYPEKIIRRLGNLRAKALAQGAPKGSRGVTRVTQQIERNWQKTSSGQIYYVAEYLGMSHWQQLSNQEVNFSNDTRTVICKHNDTYYMKIYCLYDNVILVVQPYILENED